MEVNPKLKVIAPHYANAKETFIRLDEEVNKLISLSDNSAISAQEVRIKNVLQALLVQIPAVSHDIRNLAIKRKSAVDTMERESALRQALANIERLRKKQEQPTVSQPKPEPTIEENLTVEKPVEEVTPKVETTTSDKVKPKTKTKAKTIRKEKPAEGKA